MADQWQEAFRHKQDPGRFAFEIMPGAAEFIQPTRGIHASTDGDITVLFVDGASAVTLTVKAGVLYPYCIKRCTAATATIIGVY